MIYIEGEKVLNLFTIPVQNNSFFSLAIARSFSGLSFLSFGNGSIIYHTVECQAGFLHCFGQTAWIQSLLSDLQETVAKSIIYFLINPDSQLAEITALTLDVSVVHRSNMLKFWSISRLLAKKHPGVIGLVLKAEGWAKVWYTAPLSLRFWQRKLQPKALMIISRSVCY